MEETSLNFTDDLRIEATELSLIEIIGEGSFGQVWKGVWDVGDTEVAVKKLRIGNTTTQAIQGIEREIETLAMIHHPNVLQIFGVCMKARDEVWIVMELASGCLYEVLADETNLLPWDTRMRWIKETVAGVEYLHKRGIIHRDIKSLNLLIVQDTIKICDFGLAATFSISSAVGSGAIVSAAATVGTVRWLAPECSGTNPVYSTKSDVYGLGMVIWEIVTREIPIKRVTQDAQVIYLVNHLQERPTIPLDCPNIIATIIKMCWAQNPRDRPSANKVLKFLHPSSALTKIDLPIEAHTCKDLNTTKGPNYEESTKHQGQEEDHSANTLCEAAEDIHLEMKTNMRTLMEEKAFLVKRLQRVMNSEKKLSEKLKRLERICDHKETEYQKLARAVGYEPKFTQILLRELTSFGTHRQDLILLIYHQIVYWNIIQFGDLPVLQNVIDSYCNMVMECSNNITKLTNIFSGASLLLYLLYKHHAFDLEDTISVTPLTTQSEYGSYAKLSFQCLRSSPSFFLQFKMVLGKCFGLLLSFITSQLDPMLETAIFIKHFAATNSDELRSLRPIVDLLQKMLAVFQVQEVHHELSAQFFSAVFTHIDTTLVNTMLTKRQYCTAEFAGRVAAIQAITNEMGHLWIGDVKACFQGISEVTAVLVMPKLTTLVDNKIRMATCPSLNALQLRQLLQLYNIGEIGKRITIPIRNAIIAKAPHADSDRILIDDYVRPFTIKVLHCFEVGDVLHSIPTESVRILVGKIAYGNI